MKKINILLIGLSLNVGGAEKSLVNLLNLIDYKKYNVDLLLFQKTGVFMKQIPRNVNIIESKEIDILYNGIFASIMKYGLNLTTISLSIKRYIYTLLQYLKRKGFNTIRIHRWKDNYSKYVPNCDKEYDIGIAFAGGETGYYLVDKVKSNRKIYYFHNDYSKMDLDFKLEEQYINAVDMVVTVSEGCKNSLKNIFPYASEKIVYLQNPSSVSFIKRLSDEFYPKEYVDYDGKIIVSVGRLHEQKGYDIAIDAAKIMKENGLNYKWYIVGEGKERKKLEKMILRYKLSEFVFLLGIRENPYPYMKNADILCQPSRFEGKSVVLDECKVIGTPILITNYSTASDQICNGENGIIVELNPYDLANGLIEILSDNKKLKRIRRKLLNTNQNIIEDIEMYMNIIMGDNR